MMVSFVPLTDEQTDKAQRSVGHVLNFHRMNAHHPAGLDMFLAGSEAMRTATLPRTLRELAYLQTAVTRDCGY